MEGLILRQKIGRLLLISINRPLLGNKLNDASAGLLSKVLCDEFDANDEIAAAVIHGEGGTFCEGWESTEHFSIFPKRQVFYYCTTNWVN